MTTGAGTKKNRQEIARLKRQIEEQATTLAAAGIQLCRQLNPVAANTKTLGWARFGQLIDRSEEDFLTLKELLVKELGQLNPISSKQPETPVLSKRPSGALLWLNFFAGATQTGPGAQAAPANNHQIFQVGANQYLDAPA